MRTNLEDLKKFTKDELVMRVEKLENSNTRLTSELQEFLIETSEEIMGSFDENGDAVDVKVYGYTNIQTYRLCGWLDQRTNYHNKGLFDYFFDLVRDGEFEESDYEVIDWNEVVKRYSNLQRSHYLGSITRS
jgi:hypothetical protein